MNPSKHEDPQAFKDRINRKAKELGIDHVHWRETTREDPGTGQAVRALEEGASVVIAAGGDGTVRAVAAGMAGSGVRMGIIPVGTGNVLAGNLSVPDDPEEALAVALDRNHRAVDLAWVRVEDVTQESTQPAEGGLRLAARTALHPEASAADQGTPASSIEPRADEYACLVVAGMGYDGATMADTNPELKKRIGWIAYVWAGLGAMGVPRMKARLTLRSPAARVADPLGVGDQIAGDRIDEAEAKGANIVLDGRGYRPEGAEYADGFWLAPTIIDGVDRNLSVYCEEVFGPVLVVVHADTYEEAIEIVNSSEFGNGSAIFTSDGDTARHFVVDVEAGMVGVNVPIPVPVAYYSFGGWKESLLGDTHIHGPEGVRFYTKAKVVTTRWPKRGEKVGYVGMNFPTNG